MFKSGVQYVAAPDAWKVVNAADSTLPSQASAHVRISAQVQEQQLGLWVSEGAALGSTVEVVILRRNRPPVLTVSPQMQTLAMNTVGFLSVSVEDEESGQGGPGAEATVVVSCLFGNLSVPLMPGACVATSPSSVSTWTVGSGGFTCTLSGSFSDVSAALANITYVPAPGYSWLDGLEKVSITVTDAGVYSSGAAALSATAVATIRVDVVNLPPKLFLSETVTSVQNQAIPIDSIMGSAFTVQEAAQSGALVQDGKIVIAVTDTSTQETLFVSASASRGHVLLSDQVVLDNILSSFVPSESPNWAIPLVTPFAANVAAYDRSRLNALVASRLGLRVRAASNQSMQFSGSGPFAYLNQLLGRLIYVPDVAFSGVDVVSVSVSDSRGQSEEGQVSIVVSPDTPPPFVLLSSSMTVQEDGQVRVPAVNITTGLATGGGSSSVESGDELVLVRVTAHHCRVSAPLPH